MAAAAMPPEVFAREWTRVTAQWARELMIKQGDLLVAANRWRWPSATQAQALLRGQLMHALTSGGEDHPESLAQAQADFRLPAGPGGPLDPPRAPMQATGASHPIQLLMPAALRPLSLTTYRPRQQWIAPGDTPIVLAF